MGLFYSRNDLHTEDVPQGLNQWVNHPEADPRMPNLFAARALILPSQGHSFHCHPGREEIICVLSGTIAQWIGQDRRVLRSADCACIPAGVVHASFNIGKEPAVLFVVLSGASLTEPLAIDMADKDPWRSLPTP